MVLPVRKGEDRFFDGYKNLERKVRDKNPGGISSVLYYAFDWRTRVGPFVGPDLYMLNLGIRDAAGAMYMGGFENTRVVSGTWNPGFDASEARLNGEVPEIFGVGSLQINSADANQKITQAWSMGEDRPLILGGGPHAIYQPWKLFNIGGNVDRGIDIAVRGEQGVLLGLMDVLLDYRGKSGNMLGSFRAARRDGALEQVPGLMYLVEDESHLVDTGTPRVIPDFDDLPLEEVGLSLVEGRHKRNGLNSEPVSLGDLRKQGLRSVSTLVTRGCNFKCPYCPIPSMQQFTLRAKSPERTVLDIGRIHNATGIKAFFGACDNSAYSRKEMGEQSEAMARAGFRDWLFFGTEAVQLQLDEYSKKDPGLFSQLRDGGWRAIWMGIEDLTADLVQKGQSPERTIRTFRAMRENDMYPMPMMMHYDGQPLRGPKGKLVGILDQVDFLRKQGAGTMQVTYLMPSTGSKDEPEMFKNGMVIRRVGDLDIEDRHFDGNHVVATNEADPLARQKDLLKAYGRFYNLKSIGVEFANSFRLGNEGPLRYKPFLIQMVGLRGKWASLKGWKPYMKELAKGIKEKYDSLPESPLPIMKVAGT